MRSEALVESGNNIPLGGKGIWEYAQKQEKKPKGSSWRKKTESDTTWNNKG